MSLTIPKIYEIVCLLRSSAYDTLGSDGTALNSFIMKEEVIKSIESVHPYKISKCRNYWVTKVKTPDSGTKDKRKTLTSPTKEGLYIKLVEFYSGNMQIGGMTLNALYKEWLGYRKRTVENVNTVERNEEHYKRYLANTDFFKKKLTAIKRPELKEFCISVIRGETTVHTGRNSYTPGTHLTLKEWNNVKGILKGMFEYAVDCEYIKSNPLDHMQFEKGLFRVPEPRTKESQIFNTQEEEELVEWCSEHFKETQDTAYMIPILSLTIGTRVGECVALKWTDWKDRYHLVISKQEFKNRETNEVTVVNHTKTHHNRTILLSEKAIRILNAIKDAGHGGEWIFERDGERIPERVANYVLEKYAKQTGNRIKSSHKLRKTCGSNLFKKCGLNAKQCADYLGHSEEVFVNNYLFDTDTDEELLAKLNSCENPEDPGDSNIISFNQFNQFASKKRKNKNAANR